VYAHKTTLVEQPGRSPIDPVRQVEARASAHFGGTPPHPSGEDARHDLARGAQLQIVPDLPGIQCNPPATTIDWWEPVHEVEFRLLAGTNLAGTVIRGAVRVWCGPLILAEVSIAIHVARDGSAEEPPQVREPFVQYRKIFPSYSHQDGAVVERFAEAARALGDEYLQDVLALRPGEHWNPRLLELIEDADVFQLFWSNNSMRSPHCRDEWEHAVALQRPLFIRPLYWEEPMPKDPAQELPPDALRRLHFIKVPAEQPEAAPSPSQQSRPASRLRVFINYRREDVWGEALLLYDRLAARFGTESVFLDTRNLTPGMNWLEEIKSQRDSYGVMLALIGAHWTSILKERDRAAIVEPTQDSVRYEIQYALRPNSGIRVIPVLVGDDVPFSAELLPRSLRGLAQIEVAQVRQKLFDEGVAQLIGRLEVIAREQPGLSPEAVAPPRLAQEQLAPLQADGIGLATPRSDVAQRELVLRHMVDEGNLVVFLGSRLTAGHSGPPRDPGLLPDADEIAADLSQRFGVEPPRQDLPGVAQYVYVTKGMPDLYRTLRQLLTVDCEPGPVHRFLARLPGMLEELGIGKRYQLIVSTNFDTALEQAFDREREPYDLAVYMASGPDKGKFVHFPYRGFPEAISIPNSYEKFPIRDYGELERTLIVKIHGAVDGAVGDYRWRGNYVITEDNYIDYLSRGPIESLVPTQILGKLRESHCLFLGYPVRDWNLRVFLKRIWEGRIGSRSWAVGPDPNSLEKDFWAQSNVDLYAADLGDYVALLQERLIARSPEHRDVSATGTVQNARAAESPYVGLTSYTEENAAVFFGRDKERTVLISNLRAARLTLLYARSGAGKSSLLRAGVASRLGELAWRGLEERGTAQNIPVVFSSWREDPTAGLIDAIQEAVSPFVRGNLPSRFPHQPLEDAVMAASNAADATLLVMLDQFEEYFFYQSAEGRDRSFADELASCINRPDLRANFLISIRDDAYSSLGDLFKGRIPNVYGNYLHLDHLSRESARLAIEKPIASFNALHPNNPPVEIEPGLVDAVLSQLQLDKIAAVSVGTGDLGDGKGLARDGDRIVAPYLQLVMVRLWEHERAAGSRRLRLETLERLGGAQTLIRHSPRSGS
jgi:hypothetical protein